jgi:hypothetical protein
MQMGLYIQGLKHTNTRSPADEYLLVLSDSIESNPAVISQMQTYDFVSGAVQLTSFPRQMKIQICFPRRYLTAVSTNAHAKARLRY